MGEQQTPRIGILTSAGWSTTEALIRCAHSGAIEANVGMVVTDNLRSGLLGRIARLNTELGLDIPNVYIGSDAYPGGRGQENEQTLEESEVIAKQFLAEDITLVALIGYTKKVRGAFLEEYALAPGHPSMYKTRLVKSHQGPIPLTASLNGTAIHSQILASSFGNVEQSFIAITQDGPNERLLASHSMPRTAGETARSLARAALELEKRWLPLDIDNFLRTQARYHPNGNGHKK